MAALKKRTSGHNYWSIWQRLPNDIQSEITGAAYVRNSGHIDLGDIRAVLEGLQFVFSNGRYDYEFSQGLDVKEFSEKGRKWIQEGAKDENADIRYYPMEVDGLTFGLFKWVERKHGFCFNFDE